MTLLPVVSEIKAKGIPQMWQMQRKALRGGFTLWFFWSQFSLSLCIDFSRLLRKRLEKKKTFCWWVGGLWRFLKGVGCWNISSFYIIGDDNVMLQLNSNRVMLRCWEIPWITASPLRCSRVNKCRSFRRNTSWRVHIHESCYMNVPSHFFPILYAVIFTVIRQIRSLTYV